VLTDLFQLAFAIFGSYMLAYFALEHVGGITGMVEGLKGMYGEKQHFTNFVPLPPDGSASWSFATGSIFIMYLFAQAFSNSPADGGGYLMQRMAACNSSTGAKKAALLFIFIQYIVRLWPWMIVALVALIVFPLGQEASVLAGKYAYLATDREAAYPALMQLLLPTGFLGIAILGMLAAFMSTVDTHLNWGTSYIVNDFLMYFHPKATVKTQMLVTRLSIAGFAIVGILVSHQVQNISDAWKWLALLGAGFSVPTLLRWFWWRINAAAEFTALALGLTVALFVGNDTETSFHLQLVLVTLASLIGTLLGVRFGPPTEAAHIKKFVEKVRPLGYWGEFNDVSRSNRQFYYKLGQYISLISIVVCTLFVGQSLINARFDRTLKFTISTAVLLSLYELFRRKVAREVKV
jgi:solute:Na+ symporter, SSS family